MVYYEGGALEVGKTSTVAFVWTSVFYNTIQLYINTLLLDHDRNKDIKKSLETP
jgi:hypothetical protein